MIYLNIRLEKIKKIGNGVDDLVLRFLAFAIANDIGLDIGGIDGGMERKDNNINNIENELVILFDNLDVTLNKRINNL